jgi:four helix bundle protein
MTFAKSFQDLIVYRKARALQQEIFQITRTFSKDETFALISQIRRSSRAIGANIAEAWAKRRYPAHFLSKLTDAEGELFETRIGTALDCGYINSEQANKLDAQCTEIGRMLGSMMEKAELFAGDEYRVLRDSTTEYFTEY